jgi:hypothetical protein
LIKTVQNGWQHRDGVVGFNESNNTFKKMTIGTDTGNLPA